MGSLPGIYNTVAGHGLAAWLPKASQMSTLRTKLIYDNIMPVYSHAMPIIPLIQEHLREMIIAELQLTTLGGGTK